MSASVHPWLRTFALAHCQASREAQEQEQAGFRPANKVQIVKFLTFRPESDPLADVDLWAQVSDPDHYIACRFLSHAVTAFRTAQPPFIDLTSLRGAVLLLTSARIVVWPGAVPAQIKSSPWPAVAQPGKRGGAAGALVLEVERWKLLGCVGELPFWEDVVEITALSRPPRQVLYGPAKSVDGPAQDPEEEQRDYARVGYMLRDWIDRVTL
ncbi:hypothetical protein OC834_002214 [Tilletia horrida]|nr:hypothetical protein OC834_002214 [Tilletia horrida]